MILKLREERTHIDHKIMRILLLEGVILLRGKFECYANNQ